MRKRTKKAILLVIIGLFAAAGIVRAQFPQIWQKAAKTLEEEPMVEKVTKSGEEYAEKLDNVLGKKIEDVNTQVGEEQSLPVQTIIREVVGDSEIIREIQTQVETKVIEKTQEIQDLPQEAVEEIRRQVKAEFRKQICEEWLEED